VTDRSRLTVISALGVVQILAWGSSYYLPDVLAAPIAADIGWPLSWIFGALSVGLLTAGAVAPYVGRLIGETGGRPPGRRSSRERQVAAATNHRI